MCQFSISCRQSCFPSQLTNQSTVSASYPLSHLSGVSCIVSLSVCLVLFPSLSVLYCFPLCLSYIISHSALYCFPLCLVCFTLCLSCIVSLSVCLILFPTLYCIVSLSVLYCFPLCLSYIVSHSVLYCFPLCLVLFPSLSVLYCFPLCIALFPSSSCLFPYLSVLCCLPISHSLSCLVTGDSAARATSILKLVRKPREVCAVYTCRTSLSHPAFNPPHLAFYFPAEESPGGGGGGIWDPFSFNSIVIDTIRRRKGCRGSCICLFDARRNCRWELLTSLSAGLGHRKARSQ